MSTATKATHTPGPWRLVVTTAGTIVEEIDIRGPLNSDKSSVLIATISDVNECEENMRLIAAAPEMLEALEEISQKDPCPSDTPEQCDYRRDGRCIGCIARAAIRRARGGE